GVALDPAGDVLIADSGDNLIRKVTPVGAISTIAGDGTPCTTAGCGDGGPATSAQLDNPAGLAVDADGDVLIADSGDDEIRKLAPDGTITTIAGGGACGAPPCGDGGPATGAALSGPLGLAIDRSGD